MVPNPKIPTVSPGHSIFRPLPPLIDPNVPAALMPASPSSVSGPVSSTPTLEDLLNTQKDFLNEISTYFKEKAIGDNQNYEMLPLAKDYTFPKEFVPATNADCAAYKRALNPEASLDTIKSYVTTCLENGWATSAMEVIEKQAKVDIMSKILGKNHQLNDDTSEEDLERIKGIYKMYADMLGAYGNSSKLKKHYANIEESKKYLQKRMDNI